MDPELIQKAHEAIAKGADPQKVAARFREIAGADLPSPAQAAGQLQPAQPQQEQPDAASFPAGSPSNTSGQPRPGHQDIAGDALSMFSPANVAITAASMAVPASGLLAKLGLQGATGAALGAVNAKPGHRIRGAVQGGAIGLVGGGVLEAGNAGIQALQAPGKLLSLAGEVPALRDKLAVQSGLLASRLKDEQATVASSFSEQSAVRKGLFGNAERQITEKAARATSNEAAMLGPRAGAKIREIAGIEPPLWVQRGLTKEELAQTQANLYRPLAEQHKVVSDPGLLGFVRSKPMADYTARVLGQDVAEGSKSLSFEQAQELRNYLRKNEPVLAKQMTGKMNSAFGDPLVTADQQWLDLNERLRGHKGVSIAMNSDKLAEAMVGKGISPSRVQGVREAWVADLVRKLGEKDSGAPTLERVLSGGPEWEARLSAIFHPEDLKHVRAILQDSQEKVAQINGARDVAVGDLRTKGLFADVRLEADKQKSLMGLSQQYGKSLESIGLLDQKLVSAEAKRAALQKVAEQTARRIKSTLKWTAGLVAAKEFLTGSEP